MGIWLLIVLVLAAAFVAPYYPYYLGYYNPLLGGIERAVGEVPVGWGEGLEQAAAWLNAQPGAKNLRVSAWYSDAFFPYFRGQRVSFSSSGKAQLSTDYVVFYVNQVQRQKPYPAMVRYFQEQSAAHTVLVNGVPWAWVYRAPGMQVAMPGRVEIEGRAELLGLDLPPMPTHPGQLVTVRLYLRTLGAMPEHEVWQVTLLNSEGNVLAGGRIRPAPLRRQGTTAGQLPDAIVERDVEVPLPADLPPGRYSLRIALWDQAADRLVAQFPVPEGTLMVEVALP